MFHAACQGRPIGLPGERPRGTLNQSAPVAIRKNPTARAAAATAATAITARPVREVPRAGTADPSPDRGVAETPTRAPAATQIVMIGRPMKISGSVNS